ncbi:MarR family transcriptional regulator [Jannaschia sp. Os4]|uniref:MarR family winged helix-turn-helix transcriptional regulator n=1 Tax=Jannaschia sp. Os4 TaxID=2807617 RepID=UPI00193A0A92|nr:MarR family transcriptional regulator [Jannaschia sp. Os4]MBM2576352.1 MarR family transcriptional regulator [Jannaschia sp. Os4]
MLLHAADLVDDRLRERLGALGLRPRQARVLAALSRMEPISQVRLAREFDVTPASMSTMTARLIDGGFVAREVDPAEARAHLLRLTDRGRGLVDDIHAAWRDVDRLIEERIGAEEAARLTAAARALRDALGGRAPGSDAPREDDTTLHRLATE